MRRVILIQILQSNEKKYKSIWGTNNVICSLLDFFTLPKCKHLDKDSLLFITLKN